MTLCYDGEAFRRVLALPAGDEQKARAALALHYVTKPYSPIQLLRAIRGFLRET